MGRDRRRWITPYGTRGDSRCCAAEKGYIIAGQEARRHDHAGHLGLTWAIGKTKRDFVGKRSLTLPALVATGLKQLVGC